MYEHSEWLWAEEARVSLRRSQRRRHRRVVRYRITTGLMALVAAGLALALWAMLT